MKGKSPFLVRAPKQNKDQLLINKISKEKKEIINKVTLMKKEIEALKLKVEDYNELKEEAELNKDRLKRLFDLRIIDKNGNPINNDMN